MDWLINNWENLMLCLICFIIGIASGWLIGGIGW